MYHGGTRRPGRAAAASRAPYRRGWRAGSLRYRTQPPRNRKTSWGFAAGRSAEDLRYTSLGASWHHSIVPGTRPRVRALFPPDQQEIAMGIPNETEMENEAVEKRRKDNEAKK